MRYVLLYNYKAQVACLTRGKVKFWTAELALGTLLDAVLAFLPIYFLYDVHLPRSKKTYIMGTFLVRLL